MVRKRSTPTRPVRATPEALDAWIGQWTSRLKGRRIAVAIEQKHGAVVWMLLKYECVENCTPQV